MKHRRAMATLRTGLACGAAAALLALSAPAGAVPPQGSQINGDKLVVPMYNDGSVQVIDPVTDEVTTIPNVGSHPIVLRTNADRTKAYVGNFGPIEAYITVIDLTTSSIIKKIPTLGAPYAVQTISHDGRFLYIPTALSTVQVLDTHTDEIVRTLPIAISPIHLEMTPDDSAFYVFSTFSTVTMHDAVTGAPLRPPLQMDGIGPGWGAISKDGRWLYAVNLITSDVTVIDTQEWRIAKKYQMPIGSSPLSATLTWDESELWVCNVGTNDITIMDPHTGEVKDIIKTENSPAYVNFSSDGQTAYVSDLGQPTALPPELQYVKYSYFYFLPPGGQGFINTYDTATRAQTGSTPVGGYPVAGLYP